MSSSISRRAELGEPAQRVVTLLRHTVHDRPLDADLALRQARALLLEPVRGCSQEEQYTGLVEGLASRAELSTFGGDPRWERPISEEQFRAHLHRVVAELDRMRPWTAPVLRALDDTEWPRYARARAVGRILVDDQDLEDRIPYPLDHHRAGHGTVRYVVLRLRGGRDVALAAPGWPGDASTAVLTLDLDVPARTVMVELTAGSHFEPGEWQVLE